MLFQNKSLVIWFTVVNSVLLNQKFILNDPYLYYFREFFGWWFGSAIIPKPQVFRKLSWRISAQVVEDVIISIFVTIIRTVVLEGREWQWICILPHQTLAGGKLSRAIRRELDHPSSSWSKLRFGVFWYWSYIPNPFSEMNISPLYQKEKESQL